MISPPSCSGVSYEKTVVSSAVETSASRLVPRSTIFFSPTFRINVISAPRRISESWRQDASTASTCWALGFA